MHQPRFFSCSVLLLLVLAFAAHSWAATEKVLYTFQGAADGAYPSSSLLMDTAGNLYGTTTGGGNLSDCTRFGVSGCGVVFSLSLVNGSWQEKVLYAFQGGTDGVSPTGNLLLDSSGNLFGITQYGGTGTACNLNCGTVFELSPNQNGGWTETVLYNFQGGNDGAFPNGLTFDSTGNLFGIATAGGSERVGTVFELLRSNGTWTEKTIYSFTAFETEPSPGLVFDGQGNLYGTYSQLYSCYVGCGAVFQLKRAQGSWQETDLYDFLGGGNGGNPLAGVIFDQQGNLYGTGSYGGNNFGMVFELKPGTPPLKGAMLHNFCSLNNCADGATPQSALLMDSDGIFYGTTVSGGSCSPYCKRGTVFKLAHTRLGWNESVLYTFQGGADGGSPEGNLILDSQHSLYGATASGGNKYGVVFEVTQ